LDVASFSLVEVYRFFIRTGCFHLQDTLLLIRWREHVPPKRPKIFVILNGVRREKNIDFYVKHDLKISDALFALLFNLSSECAIKTLQEN
jgi:hypothetical protein